MQRGERRRYQFFVEEKNPELPRRIRAGFHRTALFLVFNMHSETIHDFSHRQNNAAQHLRVARRHVAAPRVPRMPWLAWLPAEEMAAALRPLKKGGTAERLRAMKECV